MPQPQPTISIGEIAKAVVVASFVLSAGCQLIPPPSDASMETTFRQHRSEFEQLRQLITDDSSVGILASVSEDRTDPEFNEAARRGLSQGRLENYRHLLRNLHLRAVGRAGDDLNFQVSVRGWLLKETYKGYIYTKNKPLHIEKTLEAGGDCGNLLAKPLQGYWYLYYFSDCADSSRATPEAAGPTPRAAPRR